MYLMYEIEGNIGNVMCSAHSCGLLLLIVVCSKN